MYLIPEQLFDEQKFYSMLENVLITKGKATIVVGEGVQKEVCGVRYPLSKLDGPEKELENDGAGQPQLNRYSSGTASGGLAWIIKKKFGAKVKEGIVNPSYLQRSMAISKTDAMIAYAVGEETVRAALEGDSGASVLLQKEAGDSINDEIVPYRNRINNIAGVSKKLSPFYYLPDFNGPTDKFMKDFAFLIKDEITKYALV